MAPVIPDGSVVAFSKVERPLAGDYVVIWRKPGTYPEGQYQGLVKRLVLNIPHFVKSFPFADHPESEVQGGIFFERFNPPGRFAILCSEILAIHKAIGLLPVERGGGSYHNFADLRPIGEGTVPHLSDRR
jgi:hypothetical protein